MKIKRKPPKTITVPYIAIQQGGKKLFLSSLPAGILATISYAAVRRADEEEGAVQRPLSDRRIAGIRDFALAGGDFPACIILNWVTTNTLQVTGNKLRITASPRSAQIIDGQHRVAGLEEGIVEKRSLSAMDIPVAIYRDLSTQQCADIFLSINTEQKPVHKSLAYDLFGIASEHLVDPAAIRAADIADSLNVDEDSPYNGLIVYSGESQGKAARRPIGIPLSTAVNALKPLVSEKGVFESMGVRDLMNQTKVVTSLFKTLQEWYGDEWHDRNNAFMHSAGFTGAIEFLKANLIPYCNGKRSYAFQTIRKAMRLDPKKRIHRAELAKMQGRASARKVTDLLIAQFIPAKQQEHDLEF